MLSEVNEYIRKSKQFSSELDALRTIILETGLKEEWKWKQPCYSLNGKNIVMLGEFKAYCFISFLKGALLKDDDNLVSKIGENTQSGRIMAFTEFEKINDLATTIKAYLFEAIEIEKMGLKVQLKSSAEYEIPEELITFFTRNEAFQKAFYALSPGRQKGYLLYFSAAKQSKTRISRIENYTQQILNGNGFHDCVCGLSKRMPNCDGSHKGLIKT